MIILNPHNIAIEEWPFKFRVPSSRAADGVQPWLVDVKAGGGRCDCPAGRVKRQCKHKRWVIEYYLGLKKLIDFRMTQSEGGWRLLREFEAFVKHEQNES